MAEDICGIKVFEAGNTNPVYTGIYYFESGTQTISLVNNCNGGQYLIKLINNLGVTFLATVVQTDYT